MKEFNISTAEKLVGKDVIAVITDNNGYSATIGKVERKDILNESYWVNDGKGPMLLYPREGIINVIEFDEKGNPCERYKS